MGSSSGRSAGGKAASKVVRWKFLERYYSDPKYCRFCGEQIMVTAGRSVRDAIAKVFCSQSCSAQFYNAKRESKPKPAKEKFVRPDLYGLRTKDSIFEQYKTWTPARNMICGHARKMYHKVAIDKRCAICGYDKYVEVCHIKKVSDFSGDTPLNIINHQENLIFLCPNHHWEYDHGLIELCDE